MKAKLAILPPILALGLGVGLPARLAAGEDGSGFTGVGLRTGTLFFDPGENTGSVVLLGGQGFLVFEGQRHGLALDGFRYQANSRSLPGVKLQYSGLSASFLTGLADGPAGSMWPYAGVGLGTLRMPEVDPVTLTQTTTHATSAHVSLGFLDRPVPAFVWGLEGRAIARFPVRSIQEIQASILLGYSWGGRTTPAPTTPAPSPQRPGPPSTAGSPTPPPPASARLIPAEGPETGPAPRPAPALPAASPRPATDSAPTGASASTPSQPEPTVPSSARDTTGAIPPSSGLSPVQGPVPASSPRPMPSLVLASGAAPVASGASPLPAVDTTPAPPTSSPSQANPDVAAPLSPSVPAGPAVVPTLPGHGPSSSTQPRPETGMPPAPGPATAAPARIDPIATAPSAGEPAPSFPQPAPLHASASGSSPEGRLAALRRGDIPAALELSHQYIRSLPARHWTLRLEVAWLRFTLKNAAWAFPGSEADVFLAPLQLRDGKTVNQLFLGVYASREEAERVTRAIPGYFLKNRQRPIPIQVSDLPSKVCPMTKPVPVPRPTPTAAPKGIGVRSRPSCTRCH